MFWAIGVWHAKITKKKSKKSRYFDDFFKLVTLFSKQASLAINLIKGLKKIALWYFILKIL
jgi:hypothetical protein